MVGICGFSRGRRGWKAEALVGMGGLGLCPFCWWVSREGKERGLQLYGGRTTCSEATSSAQRRRKSSLQLEAKGVKLWARSGMWPGVGKEAAPGFSVPCAPLRQQGATTGTSQLHFCPLILSGQLGSGGFQRQRAGGWAP